MKNKTQTMNKEKRAFTARLKRDSIAWLMLAPSLILFTVFMWQPLLSGIRTSFYETKGFECINFTGLKNYIDVVTDSTFLTAMLNTLKYAGWSIILGLFTPVIVAIILNEMVHAKGFFRFSTYFPCMVPAVVTSVMWAIMYEPSAGGLFNHILSMFNLSESQWLQDPNITIPLIVLSMTWGSFGSTAILYLADLQSVNTDLYETVEIDGGGIWRKLIHITIPHMSGMIRMLFIMQIINVLKIFNQPLAMTGGGPNNASITLSMVSYNYAFQTMEIGKSTATSVITSIMIIIFTVFYMQIKNKQMDS